MHLIAVIFLSIAVIAVTVVTFIGWVVAKIGMAIYSAVTYPARARQQRVMATRFPHGSPMKHVRCSRSNCRNVNPATARFCRCCGTKLIVVGTTIPQPMRERMTA